MLVLARSTLQQGILTTLNLSATGNGKKDLDFQHKFDALKTMRDLEIN